MASIKTINAKEISEGLVGDLNVECKEKLEPMTMRLPVDMATKLKKLRADLREQGHKVTISDLIRGALQKVFGDE